MTLRRLPITAIAAWCTACGGPPVSTHAPEPTPAVAVDAAPAEPTGQATIAEPEPAAPPAVGELFRSQPPVRPPPQTHTPRPQVMDLGVKLRLKWRARVGKTTFRTTMAMVGDELVIGTHGTSLDGKNEADDGVHVLEAATGKKRRLIKAPGTGDLDIGGVAVDNGVVYYTSDNGFVVAADLASGKLKWKAALKGKVRPAPALGDFNGDGQLDVVAGDENGQLAAFDGSSGRRMWLHKTGVNDYGNKGFVGSPAIADLDGDGRDDVVAGGRDSVLTALSGKTGKILWQTQHDSGIHASPSIGDFDGDGKLEVLAAWSYGDLTVLDAQNGQELWGTVLARDDIGIEGLFGSPVPLPGAPGVIIQGTAWWDEADGIVGVGPMQREFKSFERRVSSSAVIGDLNDDGQWEAILGSEKGKLLAFSPTGGRQQLADLPGGIEAPAMIADVDHDGDFELLVASGDGNLTCFDTGSKTPPFLARFRGNAPSNRGGLGTVLLGWQASGPIPKTGAGSSGGTVNIGYLTCCRALQDEAVRAPTPHNRALLEAASVCSAAAAANRTRQQMLGDVRRALGQVDLPDACR